MFTIGCDIPIDYVSMSVGHLDHILLIERSMEHVT